MSKTGTQGRKVRIVVSESEIEGPVKREQRLRRTLSKKWNNAGKKNGKLPDTLLSLSSVVEYRI